MPNNPIGDRIYPTGGYIPTVDVLMNRGVHDGQPVYIHYTSEAGFNQILMVDRFIKGTPDRTRRGQAAKAGVYLTPSTQCFSPGDAHTLLFFAEERYRYSATHMFIFAFRKAVEVEDYPVTHGSPYREIIYRGDIDFRDNGNAVFLFAGVNRFLDGNPW
jgi:hypothetical protein